MADQQYNVDLEQMATSGRHVYDVNDQVQAHLKALTGQLEQLQSQWRGDAASAFLVLRERWDQDALKLNQALRGIGDALTSAQTDYTNRQATQQSSFSGVSSILNG